MAVEAAPRLGLRFLEGVAERRLLEASPLLGAREPDRDPVLAPGTPDDQALEIDGVRRGRRDGAGHAVRRRDRCRDALAVGSSLDDRRGPVGRDVAARVDARDRRLVRHGIDGDVARLGQLRRLSAEEVEHRVLADGEDQGVEPDLERGARDVEWDLAAGRVALTAVLGPSAHQADQAPLLHVEAGRARQLHDPDALFATLVDLLRVGGHLVDGAPVDQRDVLRAGAQRRPGAVHRRVARADHADARPDGLRAPLAEASQERDPVDDPGCVLAGQVEPLGELGAHRDEDRLEPVRPKLLQREIDPRLLVVADLDAHQLQQRDVLVDLGLRQPVRRDCSADHAAGIGVGLEDGDAEAGPRDVARS